MEPETRFCTSADGTRIAYAMMGQGPPLIVTPTSWESTNFVLEEAVGGKFFGSLAELYTVVRYDRRGVGLSQREATDFSLDAHVGDLEAVAAHLHLEHFSLLGSFHLGPTAIGYAARHSQRLAHLILYGTYASGRDLASDEVKSSLISMVRSHWGLASRALADFMAPAADGEMLERIARDERESATGETVASFLELAYGTDVVELLPEVKVPTLVLHRRGDRAVPFRMARQLTSGLPNVRLVTLEGYFHWAWFGDSASVIEAISRFTGDAYASPPKTAETAPDIVHTILFTDVEGSTALTERLGDAKARDLLREHERIVREALKAHGGSEVKTMGDGFMTSFSSATRALECAIRIQSAFAERSESAEEPIKVRIGLNAGEPIAEDDDLYGTAVNLAARIAAQAQGGEILASEAVRQIVAGKKFPFSDRGETTLRGFEDRVRIYQVSWRGED